MLKLWMTRLQALRRPIGDVATTEGRSRDRYQRAALTTIAATVQRVTSIGIGLVTIPITLRYLGAERFGLWMVLSSSVAFLNFADMGMGMGLQNALSRCIGQGDRDSQRRYVTSAFGVMALVCAVATAIALWVLPHVPLERLVVLNDELAKQELLPSAQAMVIVYCLSLMGGLVQRIYNALQRGYWAAIQLSIGNVLGLVGILLCVYLDWGLPALAACFLGGRMLVLLVGGLWLFIRYPSLRPGIGSLSGSAAREVMSSGLFALGAQISGIIILWSPALIIANRISAEAVTPFSIAQRLLALAGGVYISGILSLWPAYTDAAARGEMEWVRRAYHRSLKLWLKYTLVTLAGYLLLGQWVIRVWTGNAQVVPDFGLLVACGLWFNLHIWSMTHSTLLYGLNRMRGQAIYGNAISLVAMGAAWVVAPKVGPTGILLVMAFAGAGARGIVMRWEAKRAAAGTGIAVGSEADRGAMPPAVMP